MVDKKDSSEKVIPSARIGVAFWSDEALGTAFRIASSQGIEISLQSVPVCIEGRIIGYENVLEFPERSVPPSFRESLDKELPGSKRLKKVDIEIKPVNQDSILNFSTDAKNGGKYESNIFQDTPLISNRIPDNRNRIPEKCSFNKIGNNKT